MSSHCLSSLLLSSRCLVGNVGVREGGGIFFNRTPLIHIVPLISGFLIERPSIAVQTAIFQADPWYRKKNNVFIQAEVPEYLRRHMPIFWTHNDFLTTSRAPIVWAPVEKKDRFRDVKSIFCAIYRGSARFRHRPFLVSVFFSSTLRAHKV